MSVSSSSVKINSRAKESHAHHGVEKMRAACRRKRFRAETRTLTAFTGQDLLNTARKVAADEAAALDAKEKAAAGRQEAKRAKKADAAECKRLKAEFKVELKKRSEVASAALVEVLRQKAVAERRLKALEAEHHQQVGEAASRAQLTKRYKTSLSTALTCSDAAREHAFLAKLEEFVAKPSRDSEPAPSLWRASGLSSGSVRKLKAALRVLPCDDATKD